MNLIDQCCRQRSRIIGEDRIIELRTLSSFPLLGDRAAVLVVEVSGSFISIDPRLGLTMLIEPLAHPSR